MEEASETRVYTELTGDSKSGSFAETRQAACIRLRITPNSAQDPIIPIAFVRYNSMNAMPTKAILFVFAVSRTGPTLRVSGFCRNMKTYNATKTTMHKNDSGCMRMLRVERIRKQRR